MNTQKNINTIIKWLKKQNWDVSFHHFHEDETHYNDRVIFVCSRFSKDKQLFALLHECGHLILNKSYERWKKKFPRKAKYDEENNNKNKFLLATFPYIIDFVHEEIEAWDAGLALATRLKLKLNNKKFQNEKYHWVFDHLKGKMVNRKKVFGVFFDKKNG